MTFFTKAKENQPLKLRGEWWVPGAPDNKVPGTARITINDGCELELQGLLVKAATPFGGPLGRWEIVYGNTWSGPISLLRCLEVYRNGVEESKIYAEKVITNILVRRGKDVVFDKVSVRFTHLNEWLNYSLFDLGTRGQVTWNVDGMERIVSLPDGWRVIFSSNVQEPTYKAIQSSVEMKEVGTILLISPTARPLAEFETLVSRIRMLLTLGLQRPVYVEEMRGVSRNRKMRVGPTEYPRAHDLYARQLSRQPTDRPGAFRDTLFVFGRVEAQLDKLLRSLFSNYDAVRPLFQGHVSSFYMPLQYAEQRFLSVVMAIEQFHRLQHDSRAISKERWTVIRSSIQKVLNTEDWAQLEPRLSFAYELSLRERLVDLLAKYHNALVGLYGDRDFLVGKTVNTRNYLAHGGAKLRRKAANPKELVFITGRLELIAEVCILCGLGMEQDKVRELIRQAGDFKYSVGAARFDAH